jgi:hypothetical protein
MSCKDHGNCCCNHEVVKDCICCDWTLEGHPTDTELQVDEQIIYTVNGLCPIVSGKIKYCSASDPTEDQSLVAAPLSVLVQFLRGKAVVETKEVFLGSCIAFTVAKVDKIRIRRVPQDPRRFTLSGEFCISPNFTLH